MLCLCDEALCGADYVQDSYMYMSTYQKHREHILKGNETWTYSYNGMVAPLF